MNIILFGATGLMGRTVYERALRLGYHVRVFVRNPDALGELRERVECVKGDVLDAAAVCTAVVDRDAVISTLPMAFNCWRARR